MNRAEIDATVRPLETLQHRAAGEVLFLEGEDVAGVYVLHSGEVELLLSGPRGSVKHLRVATSGQILELSAAVTLHPHDCSAMTRTSCDLGFVSNDDLMRILDENPAFWMDVLRMMSGDVCAATAAITQVSKRPAMKR